MAITKNWRPPKASSQTSLLSRTLSLPFPHFSFVLVYFNSAYVASFLFIFSFLPYFSSFHLSLSHSFQCYPSAFLYIYFFDFLYLLLFSVSWSYGFSPRKLEEACRYPTVRGPSTHFFILQKETSSSLVSSLYSRGSHEPRFTVQSIREALCTHKRPHPGKALWWWLNPQEKSEATVTPTHTT